MMVGCGMIVWSYGEAFVISTVFNYFYEDLYKYVNTKRFITQRFIIVILTRSI